MTRLLPLFLTLAAVCFGQQPDTNAYYTLGPDSLPREGVPKGEIRGPFVLPSEVFPGDQHDYWVYVPAQYEPTTPAALMVYNDGQAYMHPEGDIRAQNVMDNLIYRREIPLMIAVFINPGRRPEQPMATLRSWGDQTSNRPDEYNSLDDRYPRVIVDELLPVIQKQYNISPNPEHRGIGGSSSGAIAAFTVAWERPNEFRKVLSLIGTYVNLSGTGRRSLPGSDSRLAKETAARFPRGRPQRQPRSSPKRRVSAGPRLVLPERPDGQRADGPRLRRQLHLGHRSALEQAWRHDPTRYAALALA